MTTAIAKPTTTFHVEASTLIPAEPKAVYALLSDYRVGHPSILPKPYFTGLTVEKGGVGAGTIVFTEMKVMGKVVHIRQEVTEPEPGRILAETDLETGQYTQFVFEPANGGQKTHLIIASEFPAKPGFMGWLEKTVQTWIIGRIYRQELEIIAEHFQK